MEKLLISSEENKELGVHFLRLSGAVDVFSYKELKDFLDPFNAANPAAHILADMSKVTYVGSSGWSVFFLQASTQEKDKGLLVLYGMNDRVKRSLDLIMPKKRGISTASGLEEAMELVKAVGQA